MRFRWKTWLVCAALPLVVGGLAGWITRGSMEQFARLNKPPLAPPGWLFPVVWTVLFLLMGTASYLVLVSGGDGEEIRRAWRVYGTQLVVNFFWSILFFSLGLCGAAFLWLVLLGVLAAVTTVRFYRLSHPAGFLMVPYLLWIAFAGYLNGAICLLN